MGEPRIKSDEIRRARTCEIISKDFLRNSNSLKNVGINKL